MKTTGIVRRIDDLGRIVIPKEIRATLKIREGDPLEIFTSRDGYVCLKKYCPLGDTDWESLTRLIKIVLPCPFVLYDDGEGVQGSSGRVEISKSEATEIQRDGSVIAFLAVNKEDKEAYGNEIVTAIKIIKEMFNED